MTSTKHTKLECLRDAFRYNYQSLSPPILSKCLHRHMLRVSSILRVQISIGSWHRLHRFCGSNCIGNILHEQNICKACRGQRLPVQGIKWEQSASRTPYHGHIVKTPEGPPKQVTPTSTRYFIQDLVGYVYCNT